MKTTSEFAFTFTPVSVYGRIEISSHRKTPTNPSVLPQGPGEIRWLARQASYLELADSTQGKYPGGVALVRQHVAEPEHPPDRIFWEYGRPAVTLSVAPADFDDVCRRALNGLLPTVDAYVSDELLEAGENPLELRWDNVRSPQLAVARWALSYGFGKDPVSGDGSDQQDSKRPPSSFFSRWFGASKGKV